jgi:excisionase family DNA binding protein
MMRTANAVCCRCGLWNNWRIVDDLLTTRQLQKLLQIDRTTIYRMLKDGRLTGVKVGNQWRFKRQEVEALLAGAPSLESNHDLQTIFPPVSTESIPFSCVQILQDVFAESAGVGAVIVAPKGDLLTKLSNCSRFCNLIMASQSGRQGCVNLWRKLAKQPEDQPKFATCRAGLQYVRARIKVDTPFEGMLIAGQFYTEPPDATEKQARLQQLAKEHDLDAQVLVEAARELPILDEYKRAQLGVWLENVVHHLI